MTEKREDEEQEKPKELKIEDLEQRTEGFKFSNNFKIRNENQTHLYVAHFWKVGFIGKELFGEVKLAKYSADIITLQKKKIISIVPLKVVKYNEVIEKEIEWNTKAKWEIYAGDIHLSPNKNNIQLTSNGKVLTDKSDLRSYRANLIVNGMTEGILLSDTLLETIFSPIDKKIAEFYEKTKSYLGAK